jgi:hypothetical protein
MKIPFALLVSVLALLLGSCAEGPLLSDEEYNATHGPAPFSPDATAHIPQEASRSVGH